MCDFWIAGQPCRFAERCWYAHGPQELRHPQDHSGHRRHNMRGNNFNRGSGEVIVDPALAAWNSAGGYQGSQIWEPPASTPSSPNLKLSPTEERFDSTFPATTKEAIPHFPFGELCKLGSIGCERRSRGSSGSIDSIESRPDRQKMRTEVECFRTMVKEAEELMRNPEQVSDMEEFWSAFTTTTSKDHQSAAPVFPKVNLPPGTENVFDDTEIWNSFALQSFLF
uniref:C3H1-type domain-containing protein n=1 Tax=Steinernema glaseri TaxID=37863 RepID=A0A1I7YJN0_9BILA